MVKITYIRLAGAMPALILLLSLTGCSSAMLRIYGLRMPKKMTDKQILRYSEKYHIPASDSYVLDSGYFRYLLNQDTGKYAKQQKNHLQPLQALYYNKEGRLQSLHINCYAGGYPNLLWNRDSILSVFPPKQQAPVDSILPLDTLLRFLRPLSTSQKPMTGSYDYVVVVCWDRFTTRQSRRLIRFIQSNCNLASGKTVRIIYANNDNLFANEDVEM